MELSHFQLPVRYDAHGHRPERERERERESVWKVAFILYDCADKNGVTSFLMNETRAFLFGLPTTASSTEGSRLPAPEGCVQCLQRPRLTGCNQVTGIVHSETNRPCARSPTPSHRTIYSNDFFLAAVASRTIRTSCVRQCKLMCPSTT